MIKKIVKVITVIVTFIIGYIYYKNGIRGMYSLLKNDDEKEFDELPGHRIEVNSEDTDETKEVN